MIGLPELTSAVKKSRMKINLFWIKVVKLTVILILIPVSTMNYKNIEFLKPFVLSGVAIHVTVDMKTLLLYIKSFSKVCDESP